MGNVNYDEIYALSTWKGIPAKKFECSLGDLRDRLPDFELRPFGSPPDNNPKMRSIVRMPFDDDNHERPVAVVSERYDLLQHRVVATWLINNFKEANIEDGTAEVTMTDYGQQVRIAIPLTKLERNTGDLANPDSFRPEIEITNSVDGNLAFQTKIRWRRLVCLNGMFSMQEDRMRSIHRIDLSTTHLFKDFVAKRITEEPEILMKLATWKSTKIKTAKLQDWMENVLRKKKIWTVENCARLWAIVETGFDGEVAKPGNNFKKMQLSQYRVGQHKKVPGDNFPIATVYDLAQLLTWVTSNQRTVEMQMEGTEAVPDLIDSYLKY